MSSTYDPNVEPDPNEEGEDYTPPAPDHEPPDAPDVPPGQVPGRTDEPGRPTGHGTPPVPGAHAARHNT